MSHIRIEAACEEVARLMEGGDWRMHVPADPTRDSHLIIAAGLRAGQQAHAALANVQALHTPRHVFASDCGECAAPWPCPTICAIDAFAPRG